MAHVRLAAQFNLCRDDQKKPCNVVNYDGAVEIFTPSTGIPVTISVSLRGQFSGAIAGTTDDERLKAAEAAAKAEILKRMDEVKLEIAKYDFSAPPAPIPTMSPPEPPKPPTP